MTRRSSANGVAMDLEADHADDDLFSALIPPAYDFSGLVLKDDHLNRPIWVTPKGVVYLETFSTIYKQAYDFLIGIAEPVTRPHYIHEYKITGLSLLAAASVGLRTSDILTGLTRLSKTELPRELIELIKVKTEKCGKTRLVLNKNRYFVESIYSEALLGLLQDPVIAQARIDHLIGFQTGDMFSRDRNTGLLSMNGQQGPGDLHLPGTDKDRRVDQLSAFGLNVDDQEEKQQEPQEPLQQILCFEVHPHRVEDVRRRCIETEYPMLEEYEFRKDDLTPNLPISLKPIAQIRSYQEKSLSKMFGNGRARSGIIVLPCGAGKTLVGITAACTMRKSTIVLCNTGVSVDQWTRQFMYWANIPRKNICVFSATVKEELTTDAALVITTYNMISYAGNRSSKAQTIIQQIIDKEWGLVILDEVHVAPAKQFRKCVQVTHSRCKLGLTATLLREDDLINHLFFLIGPKLYEANWLSLQKAGYLATVQCVEIRCTMTAEFYQEYLKTTSGKLRSLLYVMNPTKFRACQYLINFHEARGDKILVFSDNIFSLEKYAKDLKRPMIHGKTKDAERLDFLKHIQTDSNLNTLFISKIGDTSIDLPDVNVIIQISSHFGSRRQEAQRLGRILRPKPTCSSRFNAFFYTLVSEDTQEMLYATKRQSFLVDQGYSFQVVSDLIDDTKPGLILESKKSQLELLSQVLSLDTVQEEARDQDDFRDRDGEANFRAYREDRIQANRRITTVGGFAGGSHADYEEVSRGAAAPRSVVASMRTKHRVEAERRKAADAKRRQEAQDLREDEGGQPRYTK